MGSAISMKRVRKIFPVSNLQLEDPFIGTLLEYTSYSIHKNVFTAHYFPKLYYCFFKYTLQWLQNDHMTPCRKYLI